MHQERVTFSKKSCVYVGFSGILITLSVIAMFASISYQEIHMGIIFQVVYIRMCDFEVIPSEQKHVIPTLNKRHQKV